MPVFRYYSAGISQPLSETTEIWHAPLPADRRSAIGGAAGLLAADAPPTHGETLMAARFFLERDRCEVIRKAVSSRLSRPVGDDEIREIHITIVKHGAFYHPAVVSVHGLGVRLNFVLNTAVSGPGRQTARGEYAALGKLGQTAAGLFVPAVYGQGVARTPSGQEIVMFLGDWFDGFYEFHLSGRPGDDSLQLRVWDYDHAPFFLTPAQGHTLYRQAAYLLTACYNPSTSEHIFPWHHAAGDFVVRLENSVLEVRLITVRQYAPMFRDVGFAESVAAQPERMREALLLFLLNLSVRMRIDRVDGIGDLVWAGEQTVQSVWEGFVAGLQHGFFPESLSRMILAEFMAYLQGLAVFDMFELADAAAGGFHPNAAERGLLDLHLIDHVATLWTCIQRHKKA